MLEIYIVVHGLQHFLMVFLGSTCHLIQKEIKVPHIYKYAKKTTFMDYNLGYKQTISRKRMSSYRSNTITHTRYMEEIQSITFTTCGQGLAIFLATLC